MFVIQSGPTSFSRRLDNEGLEEEVGQNWITNMELLKKLEEKKDDNNFLQKFEETKLNGKRKLASFIHSKTGILVDPSSLFDVQVKRIHQYKRQHLNALQIIAQYLRIKNGTNKYEVPRTIIFGGKAAPGYCMAKLMIRFINGIADVVNSDPDMDGLLSCLLYTSPSPRDSTLSRMPSSA